jgi:hypothetical protein
MLPLGDGLLMKKSMEIEVEGSKLWTKSSDHLTFVSGRIFDQLLLVRNSSGLAEL